MFDIYHFMFFFDVTSFDLFLEISEVDYVAKLVFAMFVTNFINGVL